MKQDDKIKRIVQDYFITEVTTYEAIGVGTRYALSALCLGHSVEEAIEVACELSIYCEKPVIKFERNII